MHDSLIVVCSLLFVVACVGNGQDSAPGSDTGSDDSTDSSVDSGNDSGNDSGVDSGTDSGTDTNDTAEDLPANTFRFTYKGATGTVACDSAYDFRFDYDESDDAYTAECSVANDGAGTGAYATTAKFLIYGPTVRAITDGDFDNRNGGFASLNIMRPSGSSPGQITTTQSSYSDYSATDWTVHDSSFTAVEPAVPHLAATLHISLTDPQGENWLVDMNLDANFEASGR